MNEVATFSSIFKGNKVELSAALMKYFDKITQAVLGLDSEMMKVRFCWYDELRSV